VIEESGHFRRYLAGRLIAEVEDNVARYQHTDLIGSPRYVTDVLGQSITAKERVLAPYGSPMTGDYRNGPGFTGHMEDGATGLTYMQARYYDPTAMRFLSPDPVGVDTSTGSNFNRYNYANNNPYRFTDPDGRAPEGCGDGSCDTVELDTVVVRPSEEDRQRISDEEYLAARNQDALDFFRLVGGPAGGGFADSVDFRDNPTPSNAMMLTFDLATMGKGGAARGLVNAKRTLPALDATGKVHGLLPSAKDLSRHSVDDLVILRDELRESIQRRIQVTVEKGSDFGHAERQGLEQQLLKSIEKYLGNL